MHWKAIWTWISSTDWKPLLPSIVGALIGAVVTTTVALIVVSRTFKNNLALAARQKESRIQGILRAIRSELEILGKVYGETSGGLVQNLNAGQIYETYFLLTEKYFIVYPSNTEIVGQIEDDSLRRGIVYTYNRANFLLEMFRINNRYLDGLHASQNHLAEGQIKAHLRRHSFELKNAHTALIEETNNLIGRIDEYFAKHPLSGKANKVTTVRAERPSVPAASSSPVEPERTIAPTSIPTTQSKA
jgi:hypothetical protein